MVYRVHLKNICISTHSLYRQTNNKNDAPLHCWHGSCYGLFLGGSQRWFASENNWFLKINHEIVLYQFHINQQWKSIHLQKCRSIIWLRILQLICICRTIDSIWIDKTRNLMKLVGYHIINISQQKSFKNSFTLI